MRRALLFAAAAVAVSVIGFAALTLWALESGEVAVVTTVDESGAPRATRVWFVEREGALWLEAGTPENPWFVDVGRDPSLTLRTERFEGRFRTVPQPNPEGHERIRRWLREKYGARDAWVAFVFDTERSIAVQLEPIAVPNAS